METITKHEFTKIFSQELKNTGFMPRKYCNMECADQILRCYYKTILKCLAAGKEIMIQSWGKFIPGDTFSNTIHNPRTGKYEDVTYTRKPHFFFSKTMARKFEDWCAGKVGTLDDVLGKELYIYKARKRKEAGKQK